MNLEENELQNIRDFDFDDDTLGTASNHARSIDIPIREDDKEFSRPIENELQFETEQSSANNTRSNSHALPVFVMSFCKNFLIFACVLLFLPLFISSDNTNEIRPTGKIYEPTWESLDNRPLPEWYDNDKFGIFIHWGVYSSIGFGDWFWLNWKDREYPGATNYMNKNYKPNITYQDVAREFTAELFNATEWALLFQKSGARYVVLTSKHHEGFTLWPSRYSFSWNSVDVGPHKDLVGELATAIRNKTKIRFGLYYSLFEWYNRLYVEDRNNNFTTRRFVEMKTMPELRDLVTTYSPEVIWTDGEWEAVDDYWQAKDFLTWLYNDSPVKDTVVVNDRWGLNTLCKHGGFLTCADRYNPKKKQNRKWENAMTIDGTWGFRKNANIEDFLTSAEVIITLIETVSCGGNLLMNVGPNGLGKISPIYQERLHDVGTWLKTNGEAIYGTHPWNVCTNDTLLPDLWYTEGADSVVYAMFSKWPLDGKISVGCLNDLTPHGEIEFIGLQTKLAWSRVNDTIEVSLPNKALTIHEWAWTLKITNSTSSTEKSS